MKKILSLLVVGILVLSGLGATAVTNIENNPPDAPEIYGPATGIVGLSYEFIFCTTDPDGDDVSYYIEWGDGTSTGWTLYLESGAYASFAYTWNKIDNYDIRCKAKDIHGSESDWSLRQIPIMKNKDINLQSSSTPRSQSEMSVIPSTGKTDIAISRTTFNNGTLSGYVNDTSTNPIEGALVRVYFHGTYEENYTDSSGYYHVTNIPICYCMKNCTASKDGYKNEWVLLGIDENTTYDFVLYPLEPCYPVFNGTMGWNGWWVSPVTVSFAFDPEEVAEIWYDYKGWHLYTEPFVVDGQGDVWFEFYWVNYEGEQSSTAICFVEIDQIPPDTYLEYEAYREGWWWFVKFTCDAVDDTCGMNKTEMYVNNGLHEIITGPGPVYEFIIDWPLPPHPHVFKFVSYDNAGNSAFESMKGSDIESYPYSQSITHQSQNMWFLRWLERFPQILPILRHLLGNAIGNGD